MKSDPSDRQRQDLASARRVLAIEIAALQDVSDRLGEEFARAVDLLAAIEGKVVFASELLLQSGRA